MRRSSAAASRLRASVGESIYGEEDDDLAAVVLDLCRARGLTIGVAESCTGGLLGARLTAIPGSSDVVRGGVIAYDNDVKRDAARRRPTRRFATHGAVSEAVVRQMASGARSAVAATHRSGDHRRRRPRRRNDGEARRDGVDRRRTLRATFSHVCCASGAIATRFAQRSAQWTLEMLRQRLWRHRRRLCSEFAAFPAAT